MIEIEEYRPKIETLQQCVDSIATTVGPGDITIMKASVSDVWSRWQKLRGRVEQCRSTLSEAQQLLLQFEESALELSSQVEHAHSVATATVMYTNLEDTQTQLTQAKVCLILLRMLVYCMITCFFVDLLARVFVHSLYYWLRWSEQMSAQRLYNSK